MNDPPPPVAVTSAKASSPMSTRNHAESSNDKELEAQIQENVEAQRNAASALELSHSTLTTTLTQGEQLQHGNDLMERQSYIVKKSARLVRGMTWSGWFANKFSKDAAPPVPNHEDNNNNSNGNSPKSKKKKMGMMKTMVEDQKIRKELSHLILSNRTTEGSINTTTEQQEEQEKEIQNAIQNYHCHVLLLQQCSTPEQLTACIDVCHTLNATAITSIQQIVVPSPPNNDSSSSIGIPDEDLEEEYRRRYQRQRKFQSTLERMEALEQRLVLERQEDFQSIPSIDTSTVGRAGNQANKCDNDDDIIGGRKTQSSTLAQRNELMPQFDSTGMSSNNTKAPFQNNDNTTLSKKYELQEDHLSILSNNLQELQYMGNTIGKSLQEHNELLDVMEDGAEDLVEQTRMVVRRADRVSRRSKWKTPKAEFQCWIAMEHVPTGKYLSILPSNNNCPSLEEQFQSDASIFGVYARGGGGIGGGQQQQYHGDDKSNTNQHQQHCESNTIIGFKNKCANKWLGQTLFGSVACSATRFGKREEWELDDGIMLENEGLELEDAILHTTKILCCCANWGNGGWLDVKVNDGNRGGSFSIGGFELEAKKQAPLWSIIVLNENGTLKE